MPTCPELPAFVESVVLDADQFFMPTVKRHHAAALQKSADDHRKALAPAFENEQAGILGELRLRSIPRTESAEEARARHRLLLDDLADVPADILQAACRAYVNAEGSRFYPTAGELRVHINPLIAQRRMRAYRLAQMAREAETAFDDTQRWRPTQADLDAIKAEVRAEQGKA